MQVNQRAQLTRSITAADAAGVTAPSTVLRFPGGFDAPPTVRAGETVRFDIPKSEILPHVAGPAYHGRETWMGRLMVQVNGGEPQPYVFAQSKMGETGAYLGHEVRPVDVAIPADASSVAVWIETRGIEGERFVSNNGANFPIPVAGAAAGAPSTGGVEERSAFSTGSTPQAPDAGAGTVDARQGGIHLEGGGKSSLYALRLGVHAAKVGASAIARAAAPQLATNATAAMDRFLANWNTEGRFIPENVDGNGAVKDTKLSTLTQSRHLYGLVHAAQNTGDPAYLQRARELGDTILKHFVGREVDGKRVPPFFHEQVEMQGASAVSQRSSAGGNNLTVNQQAYGLSGLVALYGATKDPALLKDIRALHNAFVERFHDARTGGFFDHAHADGSGNDGLKSYNSTVYVAMSYLADLAAVDQGPGAPDYRGQLRELADLVVEKFPDPKTGFIVENFDADWRPAWREWQVQQAPGAEGTPQTFSIGIVGHNTQAAWFLLRQFEESGDAKYRDTAVTLMNNMLAKGYDAEQGGFYNAAKREETRPGERWMWGTNKSWWQQAEGMQALLLADKLGVLDRIGADGVSGRQALEDTLGFWSSFSRPGGGEYAEVARDGTPVPGDLGGFGKATYHVSQLAEVARDAAGG